jgi:hypothetical protein
MPNHLSKCDLATYQPPSLDDLASAKRHDTWTIVVLLAMCGVLCAAGWVIVAVLLTGPALWLILGSERDFHYTATNQAALSEINRLKDSVPGIADVLARIAAQGRPITQAEANWIMDQAANWRDHQLARSLEQSLGVPVRASLFDTKS